MDDDAHVTEGFDKAAAITRSLLGYGVVAGIFYLTVGLVLGSTREGFDLTRHPLSALMLGEQGWMQRTNLIVSGLMTGAAALGVVRALGESRAGRRAGTLVGVYGACLVASGVFPPDPVGGFPPGAEVTEGSPTGILHLAFGGIGFLALAVAAFSAAGHFSGRGAPTWGRYALASGIVILAGFLLGAALSASTLGVAFLWLAVVAGWAWLAMTSVHLYRTVPHPDLHRRVNPV